MDQSRWAPKQHEEKVAYTTPPSHSLSAAAPSFAPAPPPTEVVSFAEVQNEQFDDVVPVEESMRVRNDDDLFSDDFTPVTQPVVETSAASKGSRGRGDRTARGREDASRGSVSHASQQTAPTPQRQQAETQQQQQQPQAQPDTTEKVQPASQPRKEPVIQAVRGDRHATGGVRKPKLTEDELATKMAQISIRNAELSAAHERSEADAASFAQREQQASAKQKVERRDRQQMMGEREKNRMRKLKAMEGREWDAEKNEDDFGKGAKHDKSGGFAGDQGDYSDGREYLYREPKPPGRGGARGGGGQGRLTQNAPAKDDFPALPAAKTVASEPSSRTGEVQSWADQVEAGDT